MHSRPMDDDDMTTKASARSASSAATTVATGLKRRPVLQAIVSDPSEPDAADAATDIARQTGALVLASLQPQFDALNSKLDTALDPLRRQLEEQGEVLQAHVQRLTYLDGTVHQRGEQMAQMAAVLQELRDRQNAQEEHLRGLRTAAVSTAPSLPTADWDVAADPARLVLTTSEPVGLAATSAALQPLMAAVRMDAAHYELSAQETPAKIWFVDFRGENSTATRRATAVLNAMRLGGGRWRQLRVLTPGNLHQPVYSGRDQSLRQRRLAYVVRRLRADLQTALPGRNVTAARGTGVLMSDMQPIVQVMVTGPTTQELRFNEAGLAATGLTRETLRESLDRALGTVTPQWTE